MPENTTLVGAVVVLSVTLVELVKLLVSRLAKKNGHSCISQIEHDALMGMSSVMSKLDADGVPMVYTKRSYEDVQEKILEVCRESAEIQREILGVINRLDRRSSIFPPR